MNNQGAIELLKEMQNPLQDYADMVGAPAFAYGYRYVYPEPEDYAIEIAITALENQEKYRWHKVSDGDLPPEPKTEDDIKPYITVCKYGSDKYHKGLTIYSGTVDYTYGMDKKWWQEHCLAWMELPEYEEEQP